MDTNQVIENSEEVVETAAEAINEAGMDWVINGTLAGYGVGVLTGVLLAKYALIPFAAWAREKWNSRPPKEIQVATKTEPAEEPKEPETESNEEPTKK